MLYRPKMGFAVPLATNAEGRRRIAVNVRLAEPDTVAHLPIRRFDGLDSFDDLPRDGRTVHDMWV